MYRNINDYIRLSNGDVEIDNKRLLIEHGKDLDNINKKFAIYTRNHMLGVVNESNNNVLFTPSEQKAISELLLFALTEQKNRLINELNSINESMLDNMSNFGKNLYSQVKDKYKAGKDTIIKTADDIKTKISAINELIKNIANNAIKTVKDCYERILKILDKLDGMIINLFEKCGLDTDKVYKLYIDTANKIAKDPDSLVKKIGKEKLYESYGASLANGKPIYEKDEEEDEEDEEDNDSKTIEQTSNGSKIKSALWKMLKNILVWFVVCVVIPGFVVGMFPGTIIALLVPLVCKLAWNCYSIVKLYKQIKLVSTKWDKMKTWQKWLNGITMVLTIVALTCNFKTLIDDGMAVFDALKDGGFKLFEEAKLGVEPDTLQKWFAAFVKMVKEGKFSWEDLKEQYENIGKSFSKNVISGSTEVKTGTETVTEYKGADVDKLTQEIRASGQWKTSQKLLDWLKEKGISADELPEDGVAKVIVNGHVDAKWGQKMLSFAKESGLGDIKYAHHLNKALNTAVAKAGSVMELEMPVKLLKKMISDGVDLGYQNQYSILGVTTEFTKDVIEKVPTFTDAIVNSMEWSLPMMSYKDKTDGFKIKLGNKDNSGTWTYDIGKDGIKQEKLSDDIQRNRIYMQQENAKYDNYIDLANDENTKNDLKKKKEEFNKTFNDYECIVIYGKKANENTNESRQYEGLSKWLADEDDEDDDNEYEAPDEPILVMSPAICGIYDKAYFDAFGPRGFTYYFKELFESYTFLPVEDELTEKELYKVLCKLCYLTVRGHYDFVLDKPCDEDGNINEDSLYDPNTERYDYGMLTNKEISEIIQHKEKWDGYADLFKFKLSVAQNDEEQKEIEQDEKEVKQEIKDNEEIQKEIKNNENLRKNYVRTNTNDGKEVIMYDNLARAIAQRKAMKKKDGNWFTRLINWKKIKKFFGFGNDENDDDLDDLIDMLDNKNESAITYQHNIMNESKIKSLKQYMKDNRKQ